MHIIFQLPSEIQYTLVQKARNILIITDVDKIYNNRNEANLNMNNVGYENSLHDCIRFILKIK